MIRKTLLASAALVIAGSAGASAATHATISKDHMITSIPHGISAQMPIVTKGKGKGTFDNFASKYKKGLYWCCEGGTITGPSFVGGYSYEQAIPFTPGTSKSVTSITVGLGYVSGTNGATVALASDNSGLPGTTLASGTVSGMGTFGTCCTTVKASIASTSLTKGTQYWIVISATGTTWTAWNDSTIDQEDSSTVAYDYNNTGWASFSTNVTYSAEVN